MEKSIKLNAVIERITYRNESNGWTVFKVSSYKTPGELITVTTHNIDFAPGASVEFIGSWCNNSKYGMQFKATKAVEKKPSDLAAIQKYLGSGLIFGVGPATAKKIVQKFGEETLNIFDNNIEKLIEIPGISKKKLDSITNSWIEHREIQNVITFLFSHGISTLFAVKIYKTYGKKSIEIVSENPYVLAKDIYGIGFLTADKIALQMGIGIKSEIRLRAAIVHILNAGREMGHCYLTKEQIIIQTNKLLELTEDEQIKSILNSLVDTNEIKIKIKNEVDIEQICYYPKALFYAEKYIEDWIKEKINFSITIDKDRCLLWLTKYNQNQPFPLSDEQMESVFEILQNPFSILTGGPGCGKTTTTKTLVNMLRAMGKNITLCAPTGRAAQRMGEVIGIEAKTIHRLLKFSPQNGQFEFNEENPLYTNFVIIDETSMLDVSLTSSLLKAISAKTQVLFVGDPDQLPSVGPGNILQDIINSEVVPCLRLRKIFRQAKESLIIKNAHKINKGIIPNIISPFEDKDLWARGDDLMFIDSEEASVDDTRFLQRFKSVLKDNGIENFSYINEEEKDKDKENDKENENLSKEDMRSEDISSELINPYQQFSIPKKYKHVDMLQLLEANNYVKELRTILKKIHPYSSLYWGQTATEMIVKLYQNIIPKYHSPNVEIQILTPMTRGSLGTQNLNTLIQDRCNPAAASKPEIYFTNKIFRQGDRVIQKKNNYDLNVFNGDIGYVSCVDTSGQTLVITYSSGKNVTEVLYPKENFIELDLAYAITIHKSQGSEFETVIMPVFTQHFKMLFRNLIYTGITRAKKRIVLIGSRKAMAIAIKQVNMDQRQTLLKEGLQKII